MRALTHKEGLAVVATLLRLTVWLIWLLLIAVDGLAKSTDIKEAMYWLPFIGIGLLFAWQLSDWIAEDKPVHAVVLAIPFLVLTDFV